MEVVQGLPEPRLGVPGGSIHSSWDLASLGRDLARDLAKEAEAEAQRYGPDPCPGVWETFIH